MNKSTPNASSVNKKTSTDTGIQNQTPTSAGDASDTSSVRKRRSFRSKDSASLQSRSKAVLATRVGLGNFLNRGTWSNETFTATVNLKAIARKVLREYHMWIAQMISEGKTVSMYDLGTIRATYRNGRANVGEFKRTQSDTYVLKIKPSKKVKDALVKLAADKTRLYFGLASRAPKKFQPFHERSNKRGSVTANEGFQAEPKVESGSVGNHIHVQVGREDREAVRVAEGIQNEAGAHSEPTCGRSDRPVSTPVAPTNPVL